MVIPYSQTHHLTLSCMHPAEPADEPLQCFDENAQPREVHARSEVKKLPPRWWYATSKVWLVNDAGQLMCSKRAEGLSGNPGKWQTYFGGHVAAGLSIKESAQLELEEEAGIRRPLEDFHLINTGRDDMKKVHYEFYAVRFNGQPSDLRFTDDEVTEAKWMSMREYENEQKKNPNDWCNGCKPEQQQRIQEWVKNDFQKI